MSLFSAFSQHVGFNAAAIVFASNAKKRGAILDFDND